MTTESRSPKPADEQDRRPGRIWSADDDRAPSIEPQPSYDGALRSFLRKVAMMLWLDPRPR